VSFRSRHCDLSRAAAGRFEALGTSFCRIENTRDFGGESCLSPVRDWPRRQRGLHRGVHSVAFATTKRPY
jgi:hypothetical protein